MTKPHRFPCESIVHENFFHSSHTFICEVTSGEPEAFVQSLKNTRTTQKQPWFFPLTPPLDSVRIKTSSSTRGVFQVFKKMKSILSRFSISQRIE